MMQSFGCNAQLSDGCGEVQVTIMADLFRMPTAERAMLFQIVDAVKCLESLRNGVNQTLAALQSPNTSPKQTGSQGGTE